MKYIALLLIYSNEVQLLCCLYIVMKYNCFVAYRVPKLLLTIPVNVFFGSRHTATLLTPDLLKVMLLVNTTFPRPGCHHDDVTSSSSPDAASGDAGRRKKVMENP